jgi:hypothetical protein
LTADFHDKKIAVHDSCSVVAEGPITILPQMPNVLDAIADRKVKDIDAEEMLQPLCRAFGLSDRGGKTALLYQLMRPMCAQEVYLFLKREWERTHSTAKPDLNSLEDWNVILSNEMPQQSGSSNACALFTSAGSEILSMGGSLSMIDGEALERIGRANFAHIAKHYGGKDADADMTPV